VQRERPYQERSHHDHRWGPPPTLIQRNSNMNDAVENPAVKTDPPTDINKNPGGNHTNEPFMAEYYTPDGTLVRYNTQIFNPPEFDMDNSNNPEPDTANQKRGAGAEVLF
jgi:hypothetical protein